MNIFLLIMCDIYCLKSNVIAVVTYLLWLCNTMGFFLKLKKKLFGLKQERERNPVDVPFLLCKQVKK